MADSGVAQNAANMQNLHLDEVTGERVSKSELKKRIKARELEEKRRNRPTVGPPTSRASGDDLLSDLNPNVRLPTSTELSAETFSNISKFGAPESTSSCRIRIPTHTPTSSK